MAKKTEKIGNNRCWQGWGETKILIQCLWECKMKKPVWEQFDNFDLVIPLLVIILRKMKTYVHMKMCIWMFIPAPFIIVKKCKQSRCPPMMNKQNMAQLYNGILLGNKKERSTHIRYNRSKTHQQHVKKRSQTQKITLVSFFLHEMYRSVVVCWWEWKWGVITNAVVQSLSPASLFATPWTALCQASLSTNKQYILGVNDQNVLKLDCGDGCTLKTSEFYYI